MSQSRRLVVALLDGRSGHIAYRWTFPVGSAIQIGRGTENDVRLADDQVSRFHALVVDDGKDWILSSFGRNGSLIDGRLVSSLVIGDGDEIRFGGSATTVRFSFTGAKIVRGGEIGSRPISDLLKQYGQDGQAVAAVLWDVYFPRVVALARSRLGNRHRRVADEEDVALSVFDSLCSGLAEGRFPDLTNREDLWRLLFVVTARKCVDRVQHDRRARRGGGKVRGESIFFDDDFSLAAGLAQFSSEEPEPVLAAQLIEETDVLLSRLEGSDQAIARMKLAGHSNDEVAAVLGFSIRTVQRRLEGIREALVNAHVASSR